MLRFLASVILSVALVLPAVPRNAHGQDPAVSESVADSADASPKVTLPITQFVGLPAVPVLAPALAEKPGSPYDHLMLPLRRIEPRAGAVWNWPGVGETTWQAIVQDGEQLELGAVGERAQVRVLAFRVHADAFTVGTLRIVTPHRVHVQVDGNKLGSKKTVEKADVDAGKLEEKLKLTHGDHVVIVVAEVEATGEEDAGTMAPWTLRAEIEVELDDAGHLAFDREGLRRLKLADLLDGDSPSGVSVSTDGRVIAITVANPGAPREGRRTWIEFVAGDDGRVLRSLEGVGSLSGFAWAPASLPGRYSFVTKDGTKSTLWVGSVTTGSPQPVLEGVEKMGGARWAPDGASIILSISADGPEDPKNFKRYRGLVDRWDNSRNVSTLYQVSVPDGIVRRVTAGDLGTSLQDIAPDSRRLLFTRTLYDDATWPFARTELVELDLTALTTEVLADEAGFLGAKYGPRGETIAITGPAQAFGGLGSAVSDPQTIPNLYDTQLYLMERGSRAVRALSRDLAPAIEGMTWVGARNEIVVRATDRAFEGIFHLDVARGRWQELSTPVDVVSEIAISEDGQTLAFLANGANVPTDLWVGKTRSWKPQRLVRFEAERFDAITFGKVEDWDFEYQGETLDGHVYYPPHFDPAKKWPVIVYYYGGTTPVTRAFGGRYPKEWWAAQGYLVYVMQPSGATGFGQDFSARHVNNWGKTVADEIIAATQGFLAAHPFADAQAVGCIGASYGGFMTMLLAARTDIYAAAVSHAGISSISSYWGEGNWGYSYSSAATAHSYPWNRPDIYVDQSPLFAADEINTPLLLLHGGDDDNVPPGESEQLYTALRVLGREVEYIRIAGEKHWILDYDKRVRWSESIVAWFDKHLKKQAGWWDELWPAEGVKKDPK